MRKIKQYYRTKLNLTPYTGDLIGGTILLSISFFTPVIIYQLTK